MEITTDIDQSGLENTQSPTELEITIDGLIADYFDEKIQFIEVLDRLSLRGRDVLSYFSEQNEMSNIEIFLYCYFLEKNADSKDADEILGMLNSTRVANDPDKSAMRMCENALLYAVVDARVNNDTDTLDKVFNFAEGKFQRFMEEEGPFFSFYDALGMLEVIAATGHKDAKKVVMDNSYRDIDIERRLDNYFRMIEDVNNVHLSSRGETQIFEDVYSPIEDGLNTISAIFADVDLVDESLDFKIDDQIEKEQIAKTNLLMDSLKFDLDNRAISVVKFYLFNLVRQGELSSDCPQISKMYLDRAQRLLDIETAYKSDKMPLQTIGIEIEMPTEDKQAQDQFSRLLNNLGIPNKPETVNDHNERSLLEVMADYSYSPLVQMRMLEELAKLGVLPLNRDFENNSIGKVDADDHMSLHLNFGIPSELVKPLQNDPTIIDAKDLLIDILTYANVSPGRIMNRKTLYSVQIKVDATQESSKNKSTDYVLDDWENKTYRDKPARFEIRTNEFRNSPTFLDIVDTQLAVALFFSFIKGNVGLDMSIEEKSMSSGFNSFLHDAREIMTRYGASKIYDDPHYKYNASALMGSTFMVLECKELLNKTLKPYRHEINKILKLLRDTDL